MTVTPNNSMTKLTHPWVFICDNPECYYRTAHTNSDKAFADQLAHQKSDTCPMVGSKNYMLDEYDERGQQYTAPHMGKSLAEKLWDQLDDYLDQLKAVTPGMDDSYNKGLCSGVAGAIQMMMPHYYPTVQDVTREAVKRRSYRLGETQWAPTAGYLHNPPPPSTKAYADAVKKMTNSLPDESTAKKVKANKAAQAAPQPTVFELAPEVKEKIKKALNSGLFTDADIAISFSVPPEYISQLRVGS